MSTSFNPFQPPETRDQPRPARFTQASLFAFLMRGMLCAGLFALLTGTEQLFPELSFKNASTLTGGIRSALCTGFLFLACRWLVQSGLPGTWFFAFGAGLELVGVMAGYFVVGLAISMFPVSSLGPLLFFMNLVLNVAETVGLAVAFGWLTKRQLKVRVFVVTLVLGLLSTGLSFLVMTLCNLFVGMMSTAILLLMTISISGSFNFFCIASALWCVNLQPGKVSD